MADTFHRTRFEDGEQRLLYSRVGKFWSFFHQWGVTTPARVGPLYPSKETLLAAMESYGIAFGF